jgi:hypothetical protein
VRLDFASTAGEACCVAVDPSGLEVNPATGRRSVVLTMIPAGPGALTIAGFPGSSAASPAGVTATCALEPASAAFPCDTSSLESPSFLSDPTDVTVRAGAEVNAGDILVPAVPFILTSSLAPAPGSTSSQPVAFGATVGFSGSDVPVDDVTITASPGGEIAVDLVPCDDMSASPCSPSGSLEVRGLRAEGSGSDLPAGNTTVEIVATRSDGGAPLRIAYGIIVSQGDVPTSTPTHTTVPSTATPTSVPTATRTGTTPSTATPSTPTPTNTPRPTETSGVPTATPDPMCPPVPADGCRQSIEGNASTFLLSIEPNPVNDRLLFRWEQGNFTVRREFGDPGLVTSYALCIYDETAGVPNLVRQLFLPAGPDCSQTSAACWAVTDDGFRYDDIAGQHDGVERVDLVEGLPGQARIFVRANGLNLNPPSLPFDQDSRVIVQMKNDFEAGYCWEARFTRPAERNDPGIFRDSSDNPTGG